MLTKKGFILIPDRRTLTEAIALGNSVDQNKLQLDLDYFIPHVTVLQTYFRPEFDYKTALKKFRRYRGFALEAQTKLGEISAQTTQEHSQITWWKVNHAEWLTAFNRELVEELEDFIVKPNDSDKLKFDSQAAEDSYRRTGYARNLAAYEPHVTLAVTEEPVAPLTTKLTGDVVRFHRLAFVEHGKFGEIRNVLASEDLPYSWDW